ncbi:OmpA family protein [Granulosicoccaceae sp. 1_MG-2023]|nr:OmpA family protein [Granulosicoccaceae sp. 1_MG-2023]
MKFNHTVKWSVLVSAGLLATGCAGTPDKIAQLEDARSSYSRANADPVVAKHAALELDDAKKSLSKAEKLWKEKEDKAYIEHYAYLANQQVAIAEYRAQTVENQNQLEDMKMVRKEVQLDVRAGEIERSRKLAEAARLEAEQMAQKAEELQRQMSELQATQTERGMVLTLGDVLFDLNAATLKPGSERKIAKVAEFMNEYPEKSVVIEGHTDSTGDDTYNQNLSARRAEAVKVALVMKGVESERILTRGLGESVPVASNADRVGRQQNRRVEIIFENDTTASRKSSEPVQASWAAQ